MPAIGDRKIKDGVLGEFDGSTWRQIAAPGDRKTRDGVTGEWDGSTWKAVVEDESEPAPTSKAHTAPAAGPLSVTAADVARRGAVRVGEQIATSPNLGKAVQVASGPVARMAGRAVGVTGGLPGYVAGEALTSPAVLKAAESGVRATGAGVARVAGSKLAQAATGLPGLIGAMPFTEAGDAPAGHSAEATAARQAQFEREYATILRERAERRQQGKRTTADVVLDVLREVMGK
jgi:hypothetical protein